MVDRGPRSQTARAPVLAPPFLSYATLGLEVPI